MSHPSPEIDPLANIWRMLGKRWTVLILEAIAARGMARFGELKRAIGINGTMLSERLRELEHEGLVAKSILPTKVEYTLTESAKELQAILDRWTKPA
jgi:DNA-binding HxlR family transcriptional regulator